MNKNRFLATFASGMQFIIKDLLLKQIPDIIIIHLFDGTVAFETEKTYDRLNLHCFNNIFALISFSECSDMEAFIMQIVKSKLKSEIISLNSKKFKTFRVIASSENRLVPIENSLKAKFENFISLQSKLQVDRSKPDAEFWVSYRREGFCYFLKRLSKHTAYEKTLNKGELHPEIAYLMNWLSQPDKDDAFLDPFCGHGAIPLKRAMHFPFNSIFAFDSDEAMIETARKKAVKRKSFANMPKFIIKQLSIYDLDKELLPNSIDKIVTDPPWGDYANIQDGFHDFYGKMLTQMEHVLKENGTIVLLINRNTDIAALIEPRNLSLIARYDVLISGHKAMLVKLIKTMRN